VILGRIHGIEVLFAWQWAVRLCRSTKDFALQAGLCLPDSKGFSSFFRILVGLFGTMKIQIPGDSSRQNVAGNIF
jgi:hypothetical protein